MKVAIVGSGISGLVTAHLLAREHEVTVFEHRNRLGGHTHTVDVEIAEERHAVDTGFIVYNERTYPNFSRLLEQLAVKTQPSDMSFSVSCERTGVEWASSGWNAIFAQRRNLLRRGFLGMLREIVRFNGEARRLIEAESVEKVTLGDYLFGAGYSQTFVEHYVVPMGAAIWSTNPSTFLRFPAITFIRFFENHGLLDHPPSVRWRVLQGGSRSYLEPLVAPFRDRVRLACPVRAIRRDRDHVALRTPEGIERFDRVVLAVHSDQALRLLVDASSLERFVLSSIVYQPNDVVLHTDPSPMPARRRAWASWNYRVPRGTQDRVFVTYHMNRLQRLRARHDFFVTLNAPDRVDPQRVLGQWEFSHPVFDARAIAAQTRHAALDGANRTHFCGAYWGHGFHEDGVRSALAVARAFGQEL